MIAHKDHFHGSDLEKIEKIYGIKKEEIISFSANVNPLGISPKLKNTIASHIDAISSYPDPDYTALRERIAAYCHTQSENIIVGNGTTELISLFIQITEPKKALILGPTYSEYEREITLEGGRASYYPLHSANDFALDISDFTERLRDSVDLLVLCNPNNPTSTCINVKDMRRILDVCKEHDIYVMVDETYIEFVEDYDSVTSVPLTSYYNNIIVLRGSSKFFAAPGLRLGYAVTGNRDLISHIHQYKNPWMINSLAEIAGCIMFSDTEYIAKTKELIKKERTFMYNALKASDRYTPYFPHANFMLIKIEDETLNSSILFDKCIREKMMIRDCSTFPFLDDKFIRVCFMNHADNERLLCVLL
ncbi:MAG: aminotransferase class I/II-fold pyridoxal phosphate-dependent enzyme [Lachnospiraceae bacterium]|nr:aminotransferase class I/II-fold pyridoxal phosphate-dependent enzyme [Lachnospiraceae bacterium]